LAPSECEQILTKVLTMNDVQNEVTKSSQKYRSSRSKTKAHKWLVRFSERVSYYGFVLDVLVQQSPEYVSLAWGAMKFLFSVRVQYNFYSRLLPLNKISIQEHSRAIALPLHLSDLRQAVINHEDLTKQLAKALSKIANVMPRTDLTLILYPTERMQEVVARLYASIMQFFQKAIRWYRKGRLSHAIGSIFSPWELSWRENLEEIDLQAREIDKMASSASKAELRDIHLEIAAQRSQLAEIIALMKLQSPQIEMLVSSAMGEFFDSIC
jgi:hypothetical protein